MSREPRSPLQTSPLMSGLAASNWRNLSQSFHRLRPPPLPPRSPLPGTAILACCIMSNHIHLVLGLATDSGISLAKLLVQSEYAQLLHFQHRCSSHFWQGTLAVIRQSTRRNRPLARPDQVRNRERQCGIPLTQPPIGRPPKMPVASAIDPISAATRVYRPRVCTTPREPGNLRMGWMRVSTDRARPRKK